MDIFRHPVSWGPSDHISFIIEFASFMKKVNLPLNHLITSENDDGERNCAIDPLVIKTITKIPSEPFGDLCVP
jgi:hypothetical protein